MTLQPTSGERRAPARLFVSLVINCALASLSVGCNGGITAPPADIPQPAILPATHVVISQVYGGGGNSGATYRNDFVELYNAGTVAVSLNGWSVQYTSATGTTWQVTLLTGSISPNGYYLVQQSAGTGGTTALPTADATGTIAMSATTGKVALVTNATVLAGACPIAEGVSDFVGYGGADCCTR